MRAEAAGGVGVVVGIEGIGPRRGVRVGAGAAVVVLCHDEGDSQQTREVDKLLCRHLIHEWVAANLVVEVGLFPFDDVAAVEADELSAFLDWISIRRSHECSRGKPDEPSQGDI